MPLSDIRFSEDLAPVLERVYGKYPRLKQHGFEARTAPNQYQEGGGKMEFFHPEESHSPKPGVPLMEIYDPSIRGEQLEISMLGEAMHYLPSVDPKWEEMRQGFAASLTPEQQETDRRAYEYFEEKRPYEQWMNVSRLDQYLGGYLAPPPDPKHREEWARTYTPEQKKLLEQMRNYLQTED